MLHYRFLLHYIGYIMCLLIPFIHQCKQQKRWADGSQRASKVVAYYGLKEPPYKFDDLEPYMSKRTLEVHWGDHHRNYLEGLKKQLEKSDILYGYTFDELVKATYNNGNPLTEFNNAAQESMQPGGLDMPKLGVIEQIEKDFGSNTSFREKFIEAALNLLGWFVSLLAFLVKREERQLKIVRTSNAISPLVWDDILIICFDMWEALCLLSGLQGMCLLAFLAASFTFCPEPQVFYE
ncbi:putative superoxide dismutase [Rosa chinensis]|uniref:Superoxide dismutase n=1 Tax=Rosa chinensis TaxID=74649 RepID=A0A2P6S867_ROSCH|nr:putative superoxide dismutase [Rosa chinensis]